MPDYSAEDLETDYLPILHNEELKPEEFIKLLQKYANPSARTSCEYPYCALMKLASELQCYENWSEINDRIFSSKYFLSNIEF